MAKPDLIVKGYSGISVEDGLKGCQAEEEDHLGCSGNCKRESGDGLEVMVWQKVKRRRIFFKE